jgi:CubicO group peptidase (beta-lactamase class C family)
MSMIIAKRVDDLLARCSHEVDVGHILGGQVAVAFEGELIVNEALGDVTLDQRMHTYSAVKPTVSLTVLELAAEGQFTLDAPVAAVLPSFGTNGKSEITISQVLLHAGGFPHAPMPHEFWNDRAARLERYSVWRTTWVPGTAFEYHASSAHWVLADMITEVTGRCHADVVTERIMEPAGASRWLAIPVDQQADVANVEAIGTPPDPAAFRDKFGFDIPVTEVTNEALLAFNDPAVRAVGQPGGGGIASAASVALWYQAIMHDEGEILRPEVKVDALTVVRQDHTDWLGVPANRTHAFTLGGEQSGRAARGLGHTVSAAAFGHNGASGQRICADPHSGLSIAIMTRGLDLDDMIYNHWGTALSSKAGLLTTPIG